MSSVLPESAREPWPLVDYEKEFERRRARLRKIRADPSLWRGAREFYRERPLAFIRHWGVTYDPRLAGTETPPLMPFVQFRRQQDHVRFVYACLKSQSSGLSEKSRDMGATWDCCLISVHLFLFWHGAAVGWGSRKAMLVDRLGDPDSIFEKIRIQLRYTPHELLPVGFSLDDHMNQMRIVNPETGASITGEAGDDIGRGGRKLIYFKDESAHYEHPESIEASLEANTNVQIDISSVGGPGNVFHRRRESGVEWERGREIRKDRVNVFVMDWRHHPGKDQAWYDQRRTKAEREGLLHVFAQEVDRNYFAALQGVVIPTEWVRAAIDAHLILDIEDDGWWCAALDVADEGGDRNALVLRRGIVVRDIQEWGERDTARTARRAADACGRFTPLQLQYDCVGVGSGVKAESNNLRDAKVMPRGLSFVPWNAGEGPLSPESRVIDGDKDSPKNKDFYQNIKAQGWWMLRRRFELTHRAVTLVKEGRALAPDSQTSARQCSRLACREHIRLGTMEHEWEWSEDDLVSLPSTLPLLWTAIKELSQPTITKSQKLKLMIEKAPEGTTSPNVADAIMMCFWPIVRGIQSHQLTDEILARTREPARSQTSRLAPRRQTSSPTSWLSSPAPQQVSPEPTPKAPEKPDNQLPFPRPPSLRATRPPPAPVQRITD